MSIPEADMARYRAKAASLNLPPAETDEAINTLYRIIESRIDAAGGEDSVQLSLGERAKKAGGTHREQARLEHVSPDIAGSRAADEPGGER